MTKKISFRLPLPILSGLQAVAKRENISLSKLIVQILKSYLYT